jgi:cell division topological specificity factor
MFDFLKKFFAPETSSTTARERLRLVLLSDHLQLAPDVVEALKRDLVAVISRYCEIDESHCDVTFEQQDKQVAMLANIPIVAMKSRPGPPPAPPKPPAPEPPSTTIENAAGASAAVDEEPESATTASPAQPGAGSAKKRRRRRGGASAPQPT